MPRGNAPQTKVHYKGANTQEDFIVFVESAQSVNEWKKDRTIPLAQVVNGFKIFVTHKQGTQGVLDTASKGALSDEFGTNNVDEALQQILEKGSVRLSENPDRVGNTNDTKGGMIAHHP